MSDIQATPGADHLAGADGSITLNDAGMDAVQAYRDADRAYDRLQQSYAGAYLAGLFMRHPWLQSLRITLTATAQYNDQGGSYRSVNSSVADVVPVCDTALPDSVLLDGVFDSIEASSVIATELDGNELDLYTAFRPDYDDFDEVELGLNRAVAGALLRGTTVSGAQAFQAWFPSLAAAPENH